MANDFVPSSEFVVEGDVVSAKNSDTPKTLTPAQIASKAAEGYYDSTYEKAATLIKQLEIDGVFEQYGLSKYTEGINKDVVKNILVAIAVFMLIGKVKQHFIKIAIGLAAVYVFANKDKFLGTKSAATNQMAGKPLF